MKSMLGKNSFLADLWEQIPQEKVYPLKILQTTFINFAKSKATTLPRENPLTVNLRE